MAKLQFQLTKEQIQLIAASALFVGTCGFAHYKYFWTPVSKRVEETAKNIGEMETKIAKAQNQVDKLPQIRREIARLSEQAQEAEKKLPKNKDAPGILYTLGDFARKYRVEISNFSPGASVEKQYFYENPYSISFRGAYHDVAQFFAAIALAERIFSVRNVTFNVGPPGELATVLVTCQLIAYQYKG